MKNIIAYIIATFLCIAPATAAAQESPQSILDKVSATFDRDKGIKAELSIQLSEQGGHKRTSTGTICIKGEKFVMETPHMTTWFNGKTLWSYLPNSDEVSVSNPTKEELRNINPYLLLSSYKRGYACTLGNRKTYQGKAVYEVELTPAKADYGIVAITACIDQQTLRPLCIEFLQDDGLLTKIDIQAYHVKQDFAESLFSFDRKKYPDAEIIDLR